MTFSLEHSLEILESTPPLLSTMLRPLSSFWINAREGEEGWSAKEVVAHISLCEETNWLTRTKIILSDSPDKILQPIDMKAHLLHAQKHTMSELLDELALLRSKSLEEIRKMQLTDQHLEQAGIHPVMGSVHLRQLIATWVTHDLSHVAQIARIFAKQNQEEVGPFSRYLKILTH